MTHGNKVLVFDSTEKCAGTSIKNFLRLNFSEETFFDLDNGDPPSEIWRNYGIDCPIGLTLKPWDDFEDKFVEYLQQRYMWLDRNLPNIDLMCVYGNGIFYPSNNITKILSKTDKVVSLNKFLRETSSRIASEYYYVRGHDGHNLHEIAKRCGSLEEYILSDERPKNRICASILGLNAEISGQDALAILEDSYDFVGFVESFDSSIKRFASLHDLELRDVSVKRNTSIQRKKANNSDLKELVEHTDQEDAYLYRESSVLFGLNDALN